jgi:hypothetical protein
MNDLGLTGGIHVRSCEQAIQTVDPKVLGDLASACEITLITGLECSAFIRQEYQLAGAAGILSVWTHLPGLNSL